MVVAKILLAFPLGLQNLQSAPLSTRHAKPSPIASVSSSCGHQEQANAKDFENIWNQAHCIGKIGGKHVSIKSPLNSRFLYYNYKGFLA